MTFTKPDGPIFKYDPATKECMGENLMIPDPYEFNHVLVKQSRMKGGGDGLFTKARMFKGDIIAFYNGVRSLSKEIVSFKDKSLVTVERFLTQVTIT